MQDRAFVNQRVVCPVVFSVVCKERRLSLFRNQRTFIIHYSPEIFQLLRLNNVSLRFDTQTLFKFESLFRGISAVG